MLVAFALIAVASILLVGVRPLSSPPAAPAARPLRQLKLDMVAGFEAGVRQRDAVALVVPAAAQTFGRGVLSVLTVVIALNLFSLGLAGVGWREGEPGERFYIIAEGRTRAARDGKQLREMSTGDSFGEIALLRRIPRTATVTAVSRVEVRFLVREEFLAAVTGTPESVESAKEVVSTRLESG